METKVKYLIINADDFGRSQNVNYAIIDCFKKGVITDCNLMVNMSASLEAARLARKYNKLPIGIHFVLTSDTKMSNSRPLTCAKSLVNKDGYFFSPELSMSFWKDKIHRWRIKEIAKELNAQLLSFKRIIGKLPTHITSHHHIHAHPELLPLFVFLAKKYNIPLRIPVFHGQLLSNEKLSALKKEIITTDSFVANYKGAYKHATFRNFYESLRKIPSGTVELMVHPAFPAIGEDSIYNNWWRRELKMLHSKSFFTFINSNNIKLINYYQLINCKNNKN